MYNTNQNLRERSSGNDSPYYLREFLRWLIYLEVTEETMIGVKAK